MHLARAADAQQQARVHPVAAMLLLLLRQPRLCCSVHRASLPPPAALPASRPLLRRPLLRARVLTAVRVRLRGRAIDLPLVGGGRMRLFATSTTSLPLNFFSSSRTRRCWILWKFFSSRNGTCTSTHARQTHGA